MNFIVRVANIRPVIVKARDIKETYDIFTAEFFDKEEDPDFIPVIVKAHDTKEAYDVFVAAFFGKEGKPDFITDQVLSVELMDYEILNGDTSRKVVQR